MFPGLAPDASQVGIVKVTFLADVLVEALLLSSGVLNRALFTHVCILLEVLSVLHPPALVLRHLCSYLLFRSALGVNTPVL
jgi:hypothetical protein